MLVVGKPDFKKKRPVYLKDGRRLVGYIFSPDGPKLGYKFRPLGRDHASKDRYRTISEAAIAIGELL
jgi:hypothetical protein